MKNVNKRKLKQMSKLLLLFLVLTSSVNLFSQQSTTTKTGTTDAPQIKPPTLGNIIPQAALLSDNLATLNNSVDDIVDVKSIDENYKKIAKELKGITAEFNKFKKEGVISTNELDNLKGELNKSGQKFEDSNKALKDAIELLEKSRTEWLGYKSTWANYKEVLTSEDLPLEAKKALNSANKTISKALDVISSKLNVLMKLQQSGYSNQSVINNLNTQISILKQKKIASAFEDGSIPMYSGKFYEQFNDKLWPNMKRGFKNVILPGKSFFENNWWIFLSQLFLTIFIVYIIRKNTAFLKEKTAYAYFSNRAISAGIFFGFIFTLIFHGDMKSAPVWNLVAFLVGGLAFCRLISDRDVPAWKNNFFYILVGILAITGVFHVFNVPIVLFRIYVVLVSSFGIYKLIKWHKVDNNKDIPNGYKWLFFVLFVYLWVIVFSEIIGKEVLALYMYESLLKSVMLIVFAVVFLNMIEAGIEVGLKMLSSGDENTIDDDVIDENKVLLNKIVSRFSTFISVLIFLLGVFPRLLVFWNIYSDVPKAYDKLINIDFFSIGDSVISLGALITSICILYGSFIISIIIEMLLMSDRIERKLDQGARMSIAQLIRYFLVFFGFLIAIAALGFDLTNFTIILSALGVGIGFGLQGVVNNFVSGLILLFERPIREGDTVEIDGTWSDVKKIGLRSTTVQTFDQSDIIIPNADLVYNKVTNWTLNNQRKRVTVAVGVAYGSDINLVMKLLQEIGASVDGIVKNVKPDVLFRNFGDSTLNFELRVRAKNALNGLTVETEIRRQIDVVFSENNVEIAFPQRDLHIRSIDETALVNFNPKNNKIDTELKPIQLYEDKKIEELSKPVKKSETKEPLKTKVTSKTEVVKKVPTKVSKSKEEKPTVKKTEDVKPVDNKTIEGSKKVVTPKTGTTKKVTPKSTKPKVTKPVVTKPNDDKSSDKK